MGLRPGDPIDGTPIDWVFIGSCANSRLSDLRAAADVVRGQRVSPRRARVGRAGLGRRQARRRGARGSHRVFRDAGFEWREPGCSMCLAANGERVGPGQRSVSTTNRNFVGRQGPEARTHLASPAVAAACAVAGAITATQRAACMTSVHRGDRASRSPVPRANIDTDVLIPINRLIDNAPADARAVPVRGVALPARRRARPRRSPSTSRATPVPRSS